MKGHFLSEKERAYYESRKDAFIALRKGGATLEEIGEVYQVSRERVRQVLAKAGYDERLERADPIKIIAAARRAKNTSELARMAGCSYCYVREALEEMGRWPSVERLLKWRQRKALEARMSIYTEENMLQYLRNVAEALGHTPSMKEINRAGGPSHTTYVHHFGNWTDACRAAGLVPNTLGWQKHRPNNRMLKKKEA